MIRNLSDIKTGRHSLLGLHANKPDHSSKALASMERDDDDDGRLPDASTFLDGFLARFCPKKVSIVLEDKGDPKQPNPEKQADHPPQRMTLDGSEPEAHQYEDQSNDRYD
jgi:hypothetical protein